VQKTLNIIGCGHVGKTLGRLWATRQTFVIQDVLNRSRGSAQSATDFIGAGRAIVDYADLRPAHLYLIATPDDQITACCQKLTQTGHVSEQTIVFHCSGALTSDALQGVQQQGAAVASIHPIRSFAAPDQLIKNFAGTFCGAEGDPAAIDILRAAFSDIGAQLVAIHPDTKIFYHGAAVFACNYLTTLIAVAQTAYVKSGIPNDIALGLMEPLVRETIDNIFRIGPTHALSGPIARKDMETVKKQQRAMSDWDPKYGDLYEKFVQLTIELSKTTRPTAEQNPTSAE